MYAGIAVLLALAAVTTALPQYTYKRPTGTLKIECKFDEYAPGQFNYNCAGVDPNLITISTEHILWLKSSCAQDQQLDVVIPNYRVEELIRAALKKNGRPGSTNVNILLKKPETIYNVQAQDGGLVPQSKPVVNLQYEAVDRPVSLHYPTDKHYDRLTGPIPEPGAATSGGPSPSYY